MIILCKIEILIGIQLPEPLPDFYKYTNYKTYHYHQFNYNN